jgi:hypothetical protein
VGVFCVLCVLCFNFCVLILAHTEKHWAGRAAEGPAEGDEGPGTHEGGACVQNAGDVCVWGWGVVCFNFVTSHRKLRVCRRRLRI